MLEMLQQSFILRALLAGFALSLVAAPLGCFVIWRRMAYFGETISQAGLIGVALGFLLSMNITASVLIVAFLVSLVLIALGRQTILPFDSLLGIIAHAALAAGVIMASLIRGPQLDMMAFLFGDIFSITGTDILWIVVGGIFVLGVMLWLWRPLLATALHEELAAAEGIDVRTTKAAFIIILALTIAIAMKIVGALLTIAFLIIPGSAARPLSETPEQMALLAAVLGMMGVAGGLYMSMSLDTPGGPSIVIVLTLIFVATAIPAFIRGSSS